MFKGVYLDSGYVLFEIRQYGIEKNYDVEWTWTWNGLSAVKVTFGEYMPHPCLFLSEAPLLQPWYPSNLLPPLTIADVVGICFLI